MTVPAADNLRRYVSTTFVNRPSGDRDRAEKTAADLLEAIDALPDIPTFAATPQTTQQETHRDVFMLGYECAMQQVKALLHPDGKTSTTDTTEHTRKHPAKKRYRTMPWGAHYVVWDMETDDSASHYFSYRKHARQRARYLNNQWRKGDTR